LTVLRAYRRLLGNPALVRLLFGEFVSSVGDWLYLVALLIIVYSQTDSAVLLGLVGAARVLPYIVLSVPAGIVADRVDRRLVLLSTDVARGIIMAALAVLVWAGSPLLPVIVLAILAACFSSFFGPAIGAFLPSLVRDETELGPANSAWATLDNLAFIIGPALAGILIAVSGLTLAFALNAASFAVIAAVLWKLPRSTEAKTPATGEAAPDAAPDRTISAIAAAVPASSVVAGRPRESASFAARAVLAPLSGLVLIDAVAGIVFGGLGVLTVVIAVDQLGAGEAATGYLNAAVGVGGFIGALGSGALVLRRRLAPPLLVGAVGLGAGLAALGMSQQLGPAMVAMALTSAGSLLVEVVSTTIFQRVVPDAIRGRALGILGTITTASYAAGSFALPVLADAVGTAAVLAISGAAVVAAAIGGVLLMGGAVTTGPAPVDPAVARVTRIPAFAGLPPARLEAAMKRMGTVPVRAGESIIRQGDAADRLYVIASGTFRVTQRGAPGEAETELREMGVDEVFGEIGLLQRTPRTASVTALTDGLLLALDGPAFLELVGSGPGMMSRFLDLHRGAATPGAS
jgi:MFS family permease